MNNPNPKKRSLLPVLLAVLAGMLALVWGVGYVSTRYTTWLPAPYRKAAQAAPIDGSREEKWIADIDYYAAQLPRLHINAFHSLSAEQFAQEIESLKASVPQLSDNQIGLELVRLTAAIGDAHTRAVPAQWRQASVLPLRLYWFDDGMVVTGVMPQSQEALGARLVSVEDTPLDEVVERLEPYISSENEMSLRSNIANLLLTADVLEALGLAGSAQQVRLGFERADGTPFELSLAAVSAEEYRQGIDNGMSGQEKPLYLSKTDQVYWFEFLPDTGTLFFQYNSCVDSPERPMQTFADELFAALDANPVERLVIDLRFNGGGNSAVLDPLIERLSQHPISQEGRVFVLISRNTFSSAILNALDLQSMAGATLVGEPTADRPDHFGEVRSFTLPNSGLLVTYSTKFFSIARGEANDQGDNMARMGIWLADNPPDDSGIRSLQPDVAVPFTSQDYFGLRDPLLEAVTQLP